VGLGGLRGFDRILRVDQMVFVRFPRSMLLFFARMDESLVAHQQVAAGEGLGTDVANKGLFFRVGADVSLEVFL
jgi:hypothetical protein